METEAPELIPMESAPEQSPVSCDEPEAVAPTEVTPESPAMPAEDATDRLAAEFIRLMEEFPHLTSPAQLPDNVLDVAADEGISLLDAYLRHRWQEEKKVAAATESRRRAAQCSAGSLSRTAVETPPEQDAFLRAFRSAL